MQHLIPSAGIDLVDGDGCLYHKKYRDLVLWLCVTYGKRAAEYNKKNQHGQPSPEMLQEIKSFNEEILNNLREYADTGFSEVEILEIRAELQSRAHQALDQRIPLDAANYKEEVYRNILALNAFNPLILQTACELMNQPLLQQIKQYALTHRHHYVGVGSACMDYVHDLAGIQQNGRNSIFQDVLHFARILAASNDKTRLMPFALADVYGDLPHGESFRRIIVEGAKGLHARYVRDAAKGILHFVIARLMKKKHPTMPVHLRFWDNETVILDKLKSIFAGCSALLPRGFSLTLICYNGQIVRDYPPCTIVGTGDPDNFYHKTALHMTALGRLGADEHERTGIDSAETIDFHEVLAYQKVVAGEPVLPVLQDADGCFYGFRFTLLVKKIIFEFGLALKAMATRINFGTVNAEARDTLLASIRKLIQTTNIDEWTNVPGNARPHFDSEIENAKLHEYFACFKLLSPDLLNEILFRVNQKLIERMMEHASRAGCHIVALIFGTNRHALYYDWSNARMNGTGIFMEDLHHFTRYLNSLFHDKILFMLDRFQLADAYHHLPAGETFLRAFNCPTRIPAPHHPHSVYDPAKLNILYTLHRIALTYAGAKSAVMIDDDEQVFAGFETIFESEKFREILPTLPVTLMLFDGDFYNPEPDTVICGTGDVDENYAQTLCDLVGLAGYGLAKLAEKQLTINFNNPVLLGKWLEYLQTRRQLAQQERTIEEGAAGREVMAAAALAPEPVARTEFDELVAEAEQELFMLHAMNLFAREREGRPGLRLSAPKLLH